MRTCGLPAIFCLLVPLGLAACATASTPRATTTEQFHSLGEVDARPMFVGCTAYEHPGPSTSGPAGPVRRMRVTVRHDVTATGAAVNPVVVRRPPSAGSSAIVDRALRAAASCRYSPATIDGAPVAVRGVTRMFVLVD